MNDLELKRAEIESSVEHQHCWHSENDVDADNHKAMCCECGVESEPTR